MTGDNMAYKIGDKVRIKKDIDETSDIFSSNMRKWLGKVMTIKYVENRTRCYYYMEEDVKEGYFKPEVQECHWMFLDDDIEGYAESSSIKFDILL